MDNRFLSLKLDLKIRNKKSDEDIRRAAQEIMHSREALDIFDNGGVIPCLRYILYHDYSIKTTYGENWIAADSEILPIQEESWPGIWFIDFMKSISPAIVAGSRAEFLMLGHTVLSLHFVGSGVSMWTPPEPVTHWDSTFI